MYIYEIKFQIKQKQKGSGSKRTVTCTMKHHSCGKSSESSLSTDQYILSPKKKGNIQMQKKT